MSAVFLSHPTGNANVRAVLASLEERGLLETFFTTVGVRADSAMVRWLPGKLRAQIRKREFAAGPRRMVLHPRMEILRLLGRTGIDDVYRDLDAFVAAQIEKGNGPISGVYAYEDGALKTFLAAKESGLTCFYDLPIAYWETAQRLLREEAARLPQWEPTLVGTRDSAEKLQRKTRELELADVVFVPSRFVEESLPAEIRQRAEVVRAEFGSPPVNAPEPPPGAADGLLRVLFAGSMTQRKGLADVFAAMKRLGRPEVELVVMGSPVAPLEFYRSELPDFRYEPPRPHAQVLQLMRSCHVLVLPSLVEGRALVQQEAMACGLPLIVTPNAGGEDLIEEGRTGFLVPIRAPESIAEKLAWLADHRDALREMSAAARRKAAEYTWESYGAKVARVVARSVRREEVFA